MSGELIPANFQKYLSRHFPAGATSNRSVVYTFTCCKYGICVKGPNTVFTITLLNRNDQLWLDEEYDAPIRRPARVRFIRCNGFEFAPAHSCHALRGNASF